MIELVGWLLWGVVIAVLAVVTNAFAAEVVFGDERLDAGGSFFVILALVIDGFVLIALGRLL